MAKDTRSELQQHLHGVRRRWARLVWLQVGARVFLLVAAVVAAATIVDRWLSPDGVPAPAPGNRRGPGGTWKRRLADLAASAESGRPARRAICRRARSGARRRHRDGGRSRSSSQAERADGFAPAVIGRAIARLRALDVSEVVLPRALRRASVQAGLGAAALLVAFVFAAPFAAHVLEVARLRFLPGTIVISVQPGDVRMAAGRPLRIVARLDGRAGTLTHVTPTLAVESNGQVRTIAMQPGDDGLCRHHRSRGPFVRLSRARRDARPHSRYSVTALFPPRVQRIELHYEYPSFTGLAAA